MLVMIREYVGARMPVIRLGRGPTTTIGRRNGGLIISGASVVPSRGSILPRVRIGRGAAEISARDIADPDIETRARVHCRRLKLHGASIDGGGSLYNSSTCAHAAARAAAHAAAHRPSRHVVFKRIVGPLPWAEGMARFATYGGAGRSTGVSFPLTRPRDCEHSGPECKGNRASFSI